MNNKFLIVQRFWLKKPWTWQNHMQISVYFLCSSIFFFACLQSKSSQHSAVAQIKLTIVAILAWTIIFFWL